MRGSLIKRGKKWTAIVDIGQDENGNRKQKWLSGFKTKKEAETALASYLHQLETNTFILPEKITVGEYLRFWLENPGKKRSQTTIDGYTRNIEKHVIPAIGNIPLQRLTPAQVENFYNTAQRLDGKGKLSGTTLLQIHRILLKALGDALRKHNKIGRNIMESVDPPQKEKKSIASFYTKDQVITLLKAAEGTLLELPIAISVLLGLRKGEVLGLKWEHIKFEKGTIEIFETRIKSSKGVIIKDTKTEDSTRQLKVPGTLLSILKTHKAKQAENKLAWGEAYKGQGYVCCRENGELIHPDTLSHNFADFLDANKLPHIRFHDLRHTNASLMLSEKISSKVASKRLGHSSIAITMDLYSHVATDLDEEAAAKIDEAVSGGLKPKQ